MITLITGGPGTGKTAYTVAQLLEEKYKGRPLFVDGVKELGIEHQTFDPKNWPALLPEGALAVVDECQRYWRPAGPGAKVPDSITELETHRHKGLDFFLITQHPSLIHSNVRRLVARHIHIVSTWQGRKQYEWAECKTDPQQGRSTAVSRPYKLPKKVYSLYKSAEVHTKQHRRVPLALYVFGGAICLAGYMGYSLYSSMSEKFEEPTMVGLPSVSGSRIMRKSGKAARVEDFKPRVPHVPESAPAFDMVRKVTTFPQAKACVYSRKRGCQCYTQQGTRYLTTDNFCLSFVAQGSFDAYKPKPKSKRNNDRNGTEGRDRAAGSPGRNERTESHIL